jgi:alginate O-acetyltransferase complex protein AlgI
MVFSSLTFIFLFLPIVLGAYFAFKNVLVRNVVLLGASLLFYAWGEPIYIWIMLASIAANYFFAIWIEDNRQQAKPILTAAIVFNLSVLVFFKYCTFALSNLNQVLATLALTKIDVWQIPLPLGISFFTFHALSYVIDVFRKQALAQRRPIELALYICFFPQLIAGPIVRYHDISEQLTKRPVNADLFSEGITRFIAGLGKKVLIANILAKPTDLLFSLPSTELSASVSWLAVFLYALQVYFDFSGYSDMAIGLGLMFGFRFLENFNYPYIAQSMQELWNRWHISLSNWFRDYLFRPLGGFRRNGKLHVCGCLLTVFFFVGLWHGASWHFVAWGLYNGMFVSVERLGLGKILENSWRPFRHFYVLVVWLCGLSLFRSETLSQALTLWSNMFGMGHGTESFYTLSVILNREILFVMGMGILACTPLFRWLWSCHARPEDKNRKRNTVPVVPWLQRLQASMNKYRAIPQLTVEGAVLAVVVLQLSAGAYNPFIYFRF